MTFKEAYFKEMFGHFPQKRDRKQRPHRNPAVILQMPRNCCKTYMTKLICEQSPCDFIFVDRSKYRINTSAHTEMYFWNRRKYDSVK